MNFLQTRPAEWWGEKIEESLKGREFRIAGPCSLFASWREDWAANIRNGYLGMIGEETFILAGAETVVEFGCSSVRLRFVCVSSTFRGIYQDVDISMSLDRAVDIFDSLLKDQLVAILAVDEAMEHQQAKKKTKKDESEALRHEELTINKDMPQWGSW